MGLGFSILGLGCGFKALDVGLRLRFRASRAQDTKLNQDDPVDMWAEVR